jgi:hypothetical protein
VDWGQSLGDSKIVYLDRKRVDWSKDLGSIQDLSFFGSFGDLCLILES